MNVTVPFHDSEFWDTKIQDTKSIEDPVTPLLEDFQWVLKSLYDDIAHYPTLLLQGLRELSHWRELLVIQEAQHNPPTPEELAMGVAIDGRPTPNKL